MKFDFPGHTLVVYENQLKFQGPIQRNHSSVTPRNRPDNRQRTRLMPPCQSGTDCRSSPKNVTHCNSDTGSSRHNRANYDKSDGNAAAHESSNLCADSADHSTLFNLARHHRSPEQGHYPYNQDGYRQLPSAELLIVEAQGSIYDHYTRIWFDSTKDTDIEHIAPSSEAHHSGLRAADPDSTSEFASDLPAPHPNLSQHHRHPDHQQRTGFQFEPGTPVAPIVSIELHRLLAHRNSAERQRNPREPR